MQTETEPVRLYKNEFVGDTWVALWSDRFGQDVWLGWITTEATTKLAMQDLSDGLERWSAKYNELMLVAKPPDEPGMMPA